MKKFILLQSNKFILILLMNFSLVKGFTPIIQLPFDNSLAFLNFIKKYLPENPIIIEAGACEGNDTILMAKIWQNSTIHTFEPVPKLYAELRNKVYPAYAKASADSPAIYCTDKILGASAPEKIFTYNLALSDKTEVTKMYISKNKKHSEEFSGSSSLLKPKFHLICHPNITFEEEILVQAITLNEWANQNKIEKVDLLWLDIQGKELPVLKHAQNILKNLKVLVIEVEMIDLYEKQNLFIETKEWIEKNGFTLVACDFINRLCYSGNAVFVKRENNDKNFAQPDINFNKIICK